MQIGYLESSEQTTDTITKPLGKLLLENHLRYIGMLYLTIYYIISIHMTIFFGQSKSIRDDPICHF
jgi:hypothetical protein